MTICYRGKKNSDAVQILNAYQYIGVEVHRGRLKVFGSVDGEAFVQIAGPSKRPPGRPKPEDNADDE